MAMKTCEKRDKPAATAPHKRDRLAVEPAMARKYLLVHVQNRVCLDHPGLPIWLYRLTLVPGIR